MMTRPQMVSTYALSVLLHLLLSFAAHLFMLFWMFANPASAGTTRATGNALIRYTVGFPTYPYRVDHELPDGLSSITVYFFLCVLDSIVYGLIYVMIVLMIRWVVSTLRNETRPETRTPNEGK